MVFVTKHILASLNPQQRQAVVYQGGPLLILAGAGSGKTRVLTHRAAYLVAQGQVKANQLLLLTFTNKAAGEMKERLISLLRHNTDGQFVAGKGGPFAGTFHSFSALVLRMDGRNIGLPQSFVIYDAADQISLIKTLIKERDLSEEDVKPKMVAGLISSAKNDLIDERTFADSITEPWQEPVSEIYSEYQKRLKQANAVDFDDLLFKTIELFKENKQVLEKYRQQYQQVLVDEYQDTNRCQYMLTKMLAKGNNNLTAVGDAAQSIYGWRGADYRNMMNLTKDFSNIKIINLEQNYRSTRAILDAANSIIVKNEKHPTLKLFTKKSFGDKIVLYEASTGNDEANFISEKIKQLVDFDRIDPKQVAVLYRTNAQSRTLEEAFIRYGIPYILVGGVKFYDRAEVKDVLSLIRIFYNPKDEVSWKRIEANFGKRRKIKVEKFIKDNKNEDWQTEALFEEIVKASTYLEKYDPKDQDDYRRLENVKELLSLARQHPKISDFLENVALVQQEYSASEKEKQDSSENAIKLMTLHASKGLEFGVVFLVGMEEGLMPHSRSLENMTQMEEERRLCYVGLTRAKEKLFLTYAKKRLFFGKTTYNDPSRFIADIPSKLIDFQVSKVDDDWSESDDDDWNSW